MDPPPLVMLVDDEPDILASLELLLSRRLDARVLVAESGAEGLAFLDAGEVPDAILADYKMPDMDGLAFLTEAAERHPRVPRILMTAYPDLDLVKRSINDAGITHLITKPMSAEDVVRAVRDAVAKYRDDLAKLGVTEAEVKRAFLVVLEMNELVVSAIRRIPAAPR